MNGISIQDAAALDQPIWSALTSQHRSLALGGDLARRYPPGIAPFAALSALSRDAVAALRVLAGRDSVALLSGTPLEPMDGFEVLSRAVLQQMLWAGDVAGLVGVSPEVLGLADVPAMMDLAALTKPGPFGPQTYRLGRYIGLREGGRLVAMAGERMRLDGYTEISAVCVHPDCRGRGYAQGLMQSLIGMIAGSGDVPMLHVLEENTGAIALYKRLGFVTRASFRLTVLQAAASGGMG